VAISAGSLFREEARVSNIAVADVSRAASLELDVRTDLRTCRRIAEWDDENGKLLVVEGRLTSVMASFMVEQGKPVDDVFRVYLYCCPVEQAMRFLQRDALPGTSEAGQDRALSSALLTLEKIRSRGEIGTLGDVVAALVANEERSDGDGGELLSQLVENAGRDALDRSRFQDAYGGELDYRDPSFYDLVVDTTSTSETEKIERVLEEIRRRDFF
jgi:cytidylate kinase